MVRVDLRFFIWKSACDLKLKKKGGGEGIFEVWGYYGFKDFSPSPLWVLSALVSLFIKIIYASHTIIFRLILISLLQQHHLQFL